MKSENGWIQNIISTLVVILLFLQTFLLIDILINLRSYNQILSNDMLSSNYVFEGLSAPDFVGIDISGCQVSFHKILDNKTLVIFTSHSCSFCRSMYPELRDFMKSYPNVKVVLISMNSVDENRIFITDFQFDNFSNMYVLSVTPDVFQWYRITGTPTFLLLGKEGKIISIGYARTANQIAAFVSKEN